MPNRFNHRARAQRSRRDRLPGSHRCVRSEFRGEIPNLLDRYIFRQARSAIIGIIATTNQTGKAPPPPPFGAAPLLDEVDAPELLDEELLLDDEELELLLEDELEELEEEEELLELDDDELLELDEPLNCTTALLLVTVPAVLETVTEYVAISAFTALTTL